MDSKEIFQQFIISTFAGVFGGLIILLSTELAKNDSHGFSQIYFLCAIGWLFLIFLYLLLADKPKNQKFIHKMGLVIVLLFIMVFLIYLSIILY
jgi:hypothetical protein